MLHYNDVKLSASRLLTQRFIRAQIKENIKAPRHWPLFGKFTGDRWIPLTNGQQRGKCFHSMTSSWRCVIRAGFHAIIAFALVGYWFEFTCCACISPLLCCTSTANGILYHRSLVIRILERKTENVYNRNTANLHIFIYLLISIALNQRCSLAVYIKQYKHFN